MTPKKTKHPGALIAKHLNDANLTMIDLAFLLEKSYGIVYAVVRGERAISLDFAQKCAVIFGVPPQTYLHAQTNYNLSNNRLDPVFKKNIEQRYFKELPRFQALKSNRNKTCGRKWTND